MPRHRRNDRFHGIQKQNGQRLAKKYVNQRIFATCFISNPIKIGNFAPKLQTIRITDKQIMTEKSNRKTAISLFCSSGIGDLGLKANNVDTIVACELLPERMKLFLHNHHEAKGFCGDIQELKDDIITYYKNHYQESPFIVMATPPCQGMSSNGMGKLLNNLKKGIRPEFDPRNRLIIPAVEIVKALKPDWVIFENVPNMTNTMIEDGNGVINIIDYINRELGDDYVGRPQVIDVADYGVPQHRNRLITVLTRTANGKEEYKKSKTLIPEPTHAAQQTMFAKKWLTLRDVISDLPAISSKPGENVDPHNPLHKVPVLDEAKLSWVHNTPEGQTAMNNQCINPDCMYQGNTLHGARHDSQGVNRANTETPLYCEKCGALLPRPYTVDKKTGEKRIMKAFTSAYKRMSWDVPASTLTQNFQYACSDNKLHPSQDRVLSLYEGLVIQTIAQYPYSFEINGKIVSDGLIRDTIGESVPPLLTDKIVKHIIDISRKQVK